MGHGLFCWPCTSHLRCIDWSLSVCVAAATLAGRVTARMPTVTCTRCMDLCPSQVLKQRLRQMEIELVKLRAEQGERLKEGARRRQELSTAAKLE